MAPIAIPSSPVGTPAAASEPAAASSSPSDLAKAAKERMEGAVDTFTPNVDWERVAHWTGHFLAPVGTLARGSTRKAVERAALSYFARTPLPEKLAGLPKKAAEAAVMRAIKSAANLIATGSGGKDSEVAMQVAHRILTQKKPSGSTASTALARLLGQHQDAVKPGALSKAGAQYIDSVITAGDLGALSRLSEAKVTAMLGKEVADTAASAIPRLRRQAEEASKALGKMGKIQPAVARSLLRLAPYLSWGVALSDAKTAHSVMTDSKSSNLKKAFALGAAALSTGAAATSHFPPLAGLSVALGVGSLVSSIFREQS